MNRFQKIFFLCCLVQASIVRADQVFHQIIECEGFTEDQSGNKREVIVFGFPKTRSLNVTFTTGKWPPYKTFHLTMTQVHPLSPVLSITASGDYPSENGSLIEAKLMIDVENVGESSVFPYSARLTMNMNSTDSSQSVAQYNLRCRFEQP